MPRTYVPVFIALLTVSSPAFAQTVTPPADPRIDALAASVLGTKTPGLAVAVIHKGELVHARGYGVTDLETRRPFTLATPSYIASIGKMFTAFGVLQQVDRGRLALDTKLGDVLTETPAYAKAVTVRQLLTHTSGLVDHLDIGGDGRTYSYEDVISILAAADSLLFPPQSRSAYSNSAYVLLARILERTSGRSFEDYLRDNFFGPFNMKTAVVVTGNAQRPPERARGYVLDQGRLRLQDYQASSTTGAGGMYASVEDLVQWALALRSRPPLAPATLATASTAAVRSNGRPTPWGMGWLAEYHGEREPLAGKTYVAAIGQLGGFQGLVKWYQQDDLFIIWLANSNSPVVFDAMHKIAGLLLLSGS